MSDLVSAADMHANMEAAINKKQGNGYVDAMVLFARLVEGRITPEEIDDIKDVDLDDCTPAYAKGWRSAWNQLDKRLCKIINEGA